MKTYKILVLTDHSNHSSENSLYTLTSELAAHPQCDFLDVASRGNILNDDFFHHFKSTKIKARRITSPIAFDNSGDLFLQDQIAIDFSNYDLIFMRIPRPVSDEFLAFIKKKGKNAIFVNDPIGMIKTSSKAFLLNFQECCAPIRLCRSIADVLEFSENQDIVLKPLREFGGRGILKISGNTIDDGSDVHDKKIYLQQIKNTLLQEGYLAMSYLKNVDQGDKRILVVGGEILGASLRLPAKNSWLCNVALGGKSIKSAPTEHERMLIKKIAPEMAKQGIFIYGVDTLMNDDNKRVISEINTMSIGGFPQAQKQSGNPIIKQTIQKIIDYTNDRFNK